MAMDFIKAFWESQGATHQTSHTASWGDRFAIELEIETIAKHIKAGDRVLDIGCANGFSTFRQHEIEPQARYTGIDYAGSMIEHANKALAEKRLDPDRIRFSVASILDLPFGDGEFDVAYTTRVLINLPTWDEQKKGILESLRVVRPGGSLVISEGFWEPLCLVNSLRLMFRLEPLAEHDFNRYLKKAKLEAWLKELGLSFTVDEFSSVYYLGSRVLRELIQKEELPFGDYSSPVNKLFYDIEREYSGGGMGVQQAYIIRK
jgi:ubiquinone/menaquinone biosynthesis C-methylase UbiE